MVYHRITTSIDTFVVAIVSATLNRSFFSRCVILFILEMHWSKFYAKTRRFSDSIRTEYKSHFESKCRSEESEGKDSDKKSEEENYYNQGKPYRRVWTHQSNISIRFFTSVMLSFAKELISIDRAAFSSYLEARLMVSNEVSCSFHQARITRFSTVLEVQDNFLSSDCPVFQSWSCF